MFMFMRPLLSRRDMGSGGDTEGGAVLVQGVGADGDNDVGCCCCVL